MNEIKFNCNKCGQSIQTLDYAIGECVTCPTCASNNVVRESHDKQIANSARREAIKDYSREIADRPNNLQNIHTPYDLCYDMIMKLRDSVGEFSSLERICTFNLEFIEVLCYDFGVVEDKIWFVTDSDIKAKVCQSEYSKVNVIVTDFLNWENNMKFDVTLFNPPYHTKSNVDDRKTQPIWQKFVAKSVEITKNDGFLAAIHPSGWRNVAGVFKDTQNLLKSKSMKYLKLHSFRDGQLTFNVAINFDYYILQNSQNQKCLTTILFEDGIEQKVDISKLEFIPNENFNEVIALVAKDGEEKVEIMNNSSYHHQKEYVQKESDGEYRHPCVYTVRSPDKGNAPTFYFSNVNTKGHFGIPKVIFASGASGVLVDKSGEYGMTEFASAIVDKPENLENIKKALQSERFIRKIMGFKASLGDKYNRKIIATFRKDFWKDFV